MPDFSALVAAFTNLAEQVGKHFFSSLLTVLLGGLAYALYVGIGHFIG